ncbi:MAG: hypothetical protein AABY22_10915 [Nanoarchaeota archaeon]
MKKKKIYTREIPRRFESKKEMIKEIQRILLMNDYAIKSVFDTTKFMAENLESNVDWCKKHLSKPQAEQSSVS